MKKIFKEFREFAIKGNMFDMAIGVVIGTAFNKIVSSLVKDIIMPPLGYLIRRVDLSSMTVIIQHEEKDIAGQVTQEVISINYGIFIQGLLDFFIIAFTIFIVIKLLNRFRKKSEDPVNKEVETPVNISLLA